MQLHPQFIVQNGQREFAVLPIAEYEAMLAQVEDAEDLKELRAAKVEERHTSGFTLEEVRNQLQG